MFTPTYLAGLSFLTMGLMSSCSSSLSNTPTIDKARAQKIAATKVVTTKKKPSSFYPGKVSASTLSKVSKFSKDKHGMPTYTSQKQRTRYVRATAFSHMENEPGAPGRMNASGGILKYGNNVRSAAADWSVYPLGTKFKIKGLPYTYVVDDYGSALVGTNTVDLFYPTLRAMRKWGTRKIEITVIQWGSYDRSLRLLSGRTRYKHCRRMYYACKRMQANGVAGEAKKNKGAL